jgi:enterochelin esterase family protein
VSSAALSTGSATTTVPPAPGVDGHGVVFELADPYHRLAAVRLQQELGLDGVVFAREGSRWVLRVPRPPVDRIEYLYDIEDDNGRRSTITDPANPLRAPGAFGEKSVIEFAAYARPAWLDATGVDGDERPFTAAAPRLGGEIRGSVWSPAQLARDVAAPLLIVHDGPEFAALGSLVHCVAASIHAGALPPTRVALLAPGDRNAWYAANPDYADALVRDVLPSLPPATVRIGVGVSLGALAMLHVHRSHPTWLDGLMLQSGSFFTPDLDGQEAHFSGFGAVTGFVASVHEAERDEYPVPTVLTCGVPEENLANNRRMARTLERLGYRVHLQATRDAHNYTAWRDALDPHLTSLITALSGRHAT